MLSSDWHEKKLIDQFYRWELRGRGWHVWEYPVTLEPPFRPFVGHSLPYSKSQDDGRQPTFLSSLVGKLRSRISPESEAEIPPDEEDEDEPTPAILERKDLVELQAVLSSELTIPAGDQLPQ